jgi:hypothetical protein
VTRRTGRATKNYSESRAAFRWPAPITALTLALSTGSCARPSRVLTLTCSQTHFGSGLATAGSTVRRESPRLACQVRCQCLCPDS